ncbi:MAG TPA: sugar kinase, partial [Devosia sp.]|nr:sugar kinase [Devosia sp.]
YWRDNSAAKLLADDKDALNAAIEGASMVYFSGITLAILAPRARGRLLGAITRARDNGARIAFDTNLRPALWTSPRVMASVLTAAASLCDIVLPTHTDEAPLFGDKSVEETAERYLELGVEEVVVKDGAGEALIATPTERVRVAPKPGAKVVDATGAGDSFNGAYLSARLAGKSLQQAAEAGHRVAGIVIGQKGALVAPALVQKA